ncbi:hypothetical protein [Streptomyces sp. KR55]|uniref:hypothetical protein n=1 Tax=Streptomyces sp. KR55 TaxID=3457425 RepID=UPI003FCF6F60
MHDDDRSHDYAPGLFEMPADEWTDRQLAAGLAVLGERLAECPDDMRPRLTELAAVLAEERDRRTPLYRAVEDAMCPVQVAMPARVLRSPSERRADRREQRRRG